LIVFLVVGLVGLALLVLSLTLGDLVDVGDGLVSGTSIGVGAVVFGSVGMIVDVNGLDTWIAYVASGVVGLAALGLAQLVIVRLGASESGVAGSLVGVEGTATTHISTSSGEVSLDAAHELERRLAWSDEVIPEGSRVVVLEHAGSRVRVQRLTPSGHGA